MQKRYRVATPTLKRSLSTRTASVFNAFASSAGRSLNTKPIPDRPPCSFVSLNNIFSRTLAIVSTFLLFLFFFSLSLRDINNRYIFCALQFCRPSIVKFWYRFFFQLSIGMRVWKRMKLSEIKGEIDLWILIWIVLID